MHSGFFPVWQQWTGHPTGMWLHKSDGIKEFLAVLGRRRKVIRFFTVLGFLLGIAYAVITPPLYEAQALIEVKPQADALMNNGQGQTLPPNESIVLSNVEVLRSRDIAEHVVKNLALDTRQAFWNGVQIPTDKAKAHDIAIMRVLRDMGIKQLGRSLVVAVRYRHTDPKIAALIANGIVEVHQEQQIDDKTRQARATQEWLSARLEEMSRKLRESAGNVERYRVQMDLVDGARAEITSQQLSDISAQLIKAKGDYAAARAKTDNLDHIRKENKSLDAVKDIMQARMVELLSQDEAGLQAKMAELASRYGANHPRMKAVAAELAEVRRKQKVEIERVATRLGNDVLAEKARVDALQKSMNELEEKRRRENEAAIGLRELERESEANKLIYEDFLKRYKRVSALADIQQPDIRIVSAARVPGTPSSTPSILMIVMGSIIGVALGLMAALLSDHLENGVRSSAHIHQATGKKVLTTIPGKRPDANWVIDKPFEKPVEAIRILNHTLNASSFKTVALTSLLADESKVFTALSLARLKALSGKRVLLIDMDMRQAPLGVRDETVGTLYDAFAYKSTKQDIRVPSLSLLTGAPVTADELGKIRFEDIRQKFDHLKDSYDCIVMNVGDMATAAEARDILTWADSSICVVRTDHTPIDLIVDAAQYFDVGKKNFSGFVLAQA